MLEAIHKATGKRVSAFKLRKDLEWQGKDKDDFIAPTDLVDDWEKLHLKGIDEIELSYVHRHKRKEGTDKEIDVIEHFRSKNDIVITSHWAESDEHKLAKKYIYDNIENIILINFDDKKIIDIADIDDVNIEKGVGIKRADVLVKFKNLHPIFGRGIAFEVQISPQNKYETYERSYDRASQGYSIVWIWGNQLIDFKNRVKIIPFAEAIKEYNLQSVKENNIVLSEIAEKSKRLTNEIRLDINQVISQNDNIKKKIENIKDISIQEFKKEIEPLILDSVKKEIVSKINEENIKKTIEQLLYTNYRPIINNIVNEFIPKYFNTLKIDFTPYINSKIDSIQINEEINKVIQSEIKTIQPLLFRELSSSISSYVSKNMTNDIKLLAEPQIEKNIQKVLNELSMQNTLLWIRNKAEIVIEDEASKEKVNIYALKLSKKEDGSYELKRINDGKGKS